jgi:hypothetical protein
MFPPFPRLSPQLGGGGLSTHFSVKRVGSFPSTDTGEIDAQTTQRLECENRRLCAVGRESRSFDWSKCVHPELGQAG